MVDEKTSGKGRSKAKKANKFGVSVLTTKYGVRVLIRQGENKVWLSERHLNILFQALLEKIFSKTEKPEV